MNLFGYTGGTTLAALKAGAAVTHVDASKTSVAWARQNAEISGLSDKPVRWICDDARKFVAREERRGNVYQGIALDPPSFGRGTKGEVWKIERDLIPLLKGIRNIVDKERFFVILSSHSQGYCSQALSNLLTGIFGGNGEVNRSEMITRESNSDRVLPSGNSCCFSGCLN